MGLVNTSGIIADCDDAPIGISNVKGGETANMPYAAGTTSQMLTVVGTGGLTTQVIPRYEGYVYVRRLHGDPPSYWTDWKSIVPENVAVSYNYNSPHSYKIHVFSVVRSVAAMGVWFEFMGQDEQVQMFGRTIGNDDAIFLHNGDKDAQSGIQSIETRIGNRMLEARVVGGAAGATRFQVLAVIAS